MHFTFFFWKYFYGIEDLVEASVTRPRPGIAALLAIGVNWPVASSSSGIGAEKSRDEESRMSSLMSRAGAKSYATGWGAHMVLNCYGQKCNTDSEVHRLGVLVQSVYGPQALNPSQRVW